MLKWASALTSDNYSYTVCVHPGRILGSTCVTTAVSLARIQDPDRVAIRNGHSAVTGGIYGENALHPLDVRGGHSLDPTAEGECPPLVHYGGTVNVNYSRSFWKNNGHMRKFIHLFLADRASLLEWEYYTCACTVNPCDLRPLHFKTFLFLRVKIHDITLKFSI